MTDKRTLFVAAYLGEARLNATRAARIAGYKDPEKEGWRVKKDPEVARLISEGLDARAMTKEEVLAELSEIATMDAGEFMTVPEFGKAYFDFQKAKKNGLLHHIKKLSYTKYGPSVELVDRQAALVQVGKAHGMFTEKSEVGMTVGGELKIVVEYVDGGSTDAGNS
jgi:hypothetical protein